MEPTDEFTTRDLLTLIIAAWGAALSTFLAVRQVIRERRRARVVLMPTLDLTPPEGEEHVWTVRVVNVGHRPVEIQSKGVSTPKYWRLQPRLAPKQGSDTRLPVVLHDGESTRTRSA